MAEPIAARPQDYLSVAAGLPALPIPPGPVHSGGATPVDLTAMAFGAATNADLATINADIAADHADRSGHAADAAQKFAGHEGAAVTQLQDLAAEGGPSMSEQMPQDAMAGTMQGVISALSGALGSVGRLPQALMQAGQGALSPLMSAAQTLGNGETDGAALASDAELDPVPDDTAFGSGSGAGGGGLGVGTTPAGNLGPPPVPGTSIPTTPAGSMTRTGAAGPIAGIPAAAGAGGPMMPMMPAGTGAAGIGGKDDKAGEKRIAAPGVPNGQPVKGRAMALPNVPVTKSAVMEAGQPAIRPLKRVVGPNDSSA